MNEWMNETNKRREAIGLFSLKKKLDDDFMLFEINELKYKFTSNWRIFIIII